MKGMKRVLKNSGGKGVIIEEGLIGKREAMPMGRDCYGLVSRMGARKKVLLRGLKSFGSAQLVLP